MSADCRCTARLVAASLVLGWVWLGEPAPTRAQLPLGEEFRVNSYTTDTQYQPAVASHSDGSFVVVWNSREQDGDDWGVFGQRYDADGDPLGGEFQVNTYTTGSQGGFGEGTPSVATDSDGNFVVVWASDRPVGRRVVGRRYDAEGNPVGGEFQVSSNVPFGTVDPVVATDADGNFVVVWDNGAISGRRFDASGTPVGAEFVVNQPSFQNRFYSPVVAASENGKFVVSWTASYYTTFLPPLYVEVFARRYDAAGNAVGNQFQVNSFDYYFQGHSDLVMDPDGAFLVVWESFPYCIVDEEECAPVARPSVDFGINGQRFDAEGQQAGGEFQIAPQQFQYHGDPRIARRSEDELVVVWKANDGSNYGVHGRVFNDSGVLLGNEFQVNTYATGHQTMADVTPTMDGNFVVVWSGAGSSDPGGVFGQRITTSALTLEMTGGGCPGQATATISNAPPNSEVALVRAANQNGFVKGGALCNGTQFEIGEPFQLPPVFVIVDGNGEGSAELELSFNRCYVQALALQSCETSNALRVR